MKAKDRQQDGALGQSADGTAARASNTTSSNMHAWTAGTFYLPPTTQCAKAEAGKPPTSQLQQYPGTCPAPATSLTFIMGSNSRLLSCGDPLTQCGPINE